MAATNGSSWTGAFLLVCVLLLTAGPLRQAAAVKETFEERAEARRAELIDKAVKRGWHGHFTARGGAAGAAPVL